MKRADAEAILINSPRGRRRAARKGLDSETIRIKGPQRENNGTQKESRCSCYTDQGHAGG